MPRFGIPPVPAGQAIERNLLYTTLPASRQGGFYFLTLPRVVILYQLAPVGHTDPIGTKPFPGYNTA